MRLVFMGTPDFAVPTLKALIKEGHEILAVFTQTDKPVGRKQILTPPPVKICAMENGIDIYQPTTLRSGEAFQILKDINPEAIVVVAYGKILPEDILSLPKYGCINGHASILPRHRGASPIQWSIFSGDKETGVTTQRMDSGIDTGDILEISKTEISDTETAETLHDRLSLMCAELMCSTIGKLEKGEIRPVKQDEKDATYCSIIKKEMALLDFTKNATELDRAIRAFYGWPVAFFMLEGKRMKVFSAKILKGDGSMGTVIDNKDKLVISCGDNTALELIDVQLEGSKPMTAKALLCGKNIPIGTKII